MEIVSAGGPPPRPPSGLRTVAHTVELPHELWVHVFSFLVNTRELPKVFLVCRDWQSLAHDKRLWQSVDLSHRLEKRVVLGLSLLLYSTRRLRVRNAILGDDLLVTLCRRVPLLRDLDLTNNQGSGRFVELLVQHCPRLEVLVLAHCKMVSNSDVRRLVQGCPRLRKLKLDKNSNVSDESCLALAQLSTLSRLSLARCYSLTDSAVLLLTKSSSLVSLDLRGCTALSHSCLETMRKNVRKVKGP